MRNVKMYMYANFEGFLVKNGRKIASGPLPDHLVSQPERKLKIGLHSDLDIWITFQKSYQPLLYDVIFLPFAGTQKFVKTKIS